MTLWVGRGCRSKSLTIVIVMGVSLLCLFYILMSRTNHYREAYSLEQQLNIDFSSSEWMARANARQVPVAVGVGEIEADKNHRENRRSLAVANPYKPSKC